MATLYVREFETLPVVAGIPAQIWAEPGTADQTISLSGSSASITLNAKTKYVMMASDAIYSYTVAGPAGTATATTSMMRIPADNIISLSVPPGGAKIAAITNT
ncbi:hypothetical protein QIH93_15030 [Bradyrhizobium ottawaense]|jgi:hypothetical protein|uniref:hypothetical protein n=1 Tax=Bradyrhizobium ottawaense TaxID=931866 RepID=UPI002715458D|nr:hypothetical protein [Bradyrhizobium ottawaense]WLB49226.1 hypothetical protein QIH93_15030 [Bradyrhizobium ottawaense]